MPKIFNSKVSLYADDSKLIVYANSAENIESTEVDLDAFTHWANICKLEFNAAKYKAVHLGKNRHTQRVTGLAKLFPAATQ